MTRSTSLITSPWRYELTPSEIKHVQYVARMSEMRSWERQIAGIGRGERDGGAGRNKYYPDKKADGFAGEIVVARLYGDDEWLPQPVKKGRFKDIPDAGGRGGVRTTRDRLSLILHPDDPDWMPFHLVYGSRSEEMELQGWIYAYEGKVPEFWKSESKKNPDTFTPAYFIHPKDYEFHHPRELPPWWKTPRKR
jgi:hypothetical protein